MLARSRVVLSIALAAGCASSVEQTPDSHTIPQGAVSASVPGQPPPAEAGTATRSEAPTAPLAGTYDITSGVTPSGAPHVGSIMFEFRIQNEREGDVVVVYDVKRTPAGQLSKGLAMAFGDEVAVGWGEEEFGVAVHSWVEGGLRGRWTAQWAQGKLAYETGRRESATTFAVSGHDPDLTKTYDCTLRVEETGDTLAVDWLFGKTTLRGVGVAIGEDHFVTGWAPKGETAVSHYRVSGKRLSGRWSTSGSRQLGSEELLRR